MVERWAHQMISALTGWVLGGASPIRDSKLLSRAVSGRSWLRSALSSGWSKLQALTGVESEGAMRSEVVGQPATRKVTDLKRHETHVKRRRPLANLTTNTTNTTVRHHHQYVPETASSGQPPLDNDRPARPSESRAASVHIPNQAYQTQPQQLYLLPAHKYLPR